MDKKAKGKVPKAVKRAEKENVSEMEKAPAMEKPKKKTQRSLHYSRDRFAAQFDRW